MATLPNGDNLKPDITVLIPAFRHEKFIEDTLRSVLAQSYRAFQILVVDDASTDATLERARSLNDPRITVKANVTNMGLGNSVIAALETITTPFVALLNSDDIFHPERLERCREVLLRSPSTQLVATGVSLIDANGGHLTFDNVSRILDGRKIYHWVRWFDQIQSNGDGETVFLRLLKHNVLLTSSNIVCRTSYLREQAATLTGLRYCFDWHLFLAAAVNGGLRSLPDALVAYRLHAQNTVWFSAETRWSYFFEVNRVAAHAMKSFLASVADSEIGEAELEKVLAAVVLHLSANAEVDGLALYLNEILPAIQLQNAGDRLPTIRGLIEQLHDQAKRMRQQR